MQAWFDPNTYTIDCDYGTVSQVYSDQRQEEHRSVGMS